MMMLVASVVASVVAFEHGYSATSSEGLHLTLQAMYAATATMCSLLR